MRTISGNSKFCFEKQRCENEGLGGKHIHPFVTSCGSNGHIEITPMKNMPHKLHISALIAMLLMPASLFAQKATLPAPPEHPEHHPDWRHVPGGTGNPLQALTKRLNLSVDQQARIQPIIQGTLPGT